MWQTMLETHETAVLGLIGPIGWTEVVILAVIGLLIFGKRLPEVGKSLGKGIVEFKRGLAGIEQDVNDAGETGKQQPPRIEPHEAESKDAAGGEQSQSSTGGGEKAPHST